ncbi:restriction endonuclease subunit S [Mycoplasma sp. SK341A]|uniref:restriction endonuclease subunit S n=1 Tax=Mycoplasma sp. SK341A TaxID=3401679 RepID=UPI003AB03CE8
MLDKKMVPEIRFKGFKEDWKESKIGNFLSIPIEEKADVNNASQLLTLGLNLSGLKNGATKNKLHFGATNYFLRKEGQFIYGKQNFFNGSMAIITPEFHNKASSKDVPSFNVNNIDNWFFYYYLARPSFYEKTEDLSLGTGSKRIHENILFNISIAHPELLEEQKKIRSLISNLNSIVSFNSIKLNKLRVIKQSLLDKMFALYDKKVPEIRFKDFLDMWNHKPAKNLGYITTGNSNTQDSNINGAYPFFIRSDKPLKSDKFLYDEEAVITIGDGNIGKVFHYINGKFDLHQRCYKISNFTDVLGKYFYWYFSSNFYNRVIRMSAKATVDSVRLEMIADMEIYFPSDKNEQSKISIFLDSLDSLIYYQEQKLEKLNNIKQALLEKMFC